jgi:aspartate racemase
VALLVSAARRLAAGGAEGLVICTNTMHIGAEAVEAAVSLPVIHIADATADAVRQAGCTRPILLATRFTMEREFYKGRLRDKHGIEVLVPDEEDRAEVHRIIYEELCRGVVRPDAKAASLDLIEGLRRRGGDGVILGCTELTMLIGPDDLRLPVFDTTRIHAEAAMRFALGEGGGSAALEASSQRPLNPPSQERRSCP